jgi:hypothetical protein
VRTCRLPAEIPPLRHHTPGSGMQQLLRFSSRLGTGALFAMTLFFSCHSIEQCDNDIGVLSLCLKSNEEICDNHVITQPKYVHR